MVGMRMGLEQPVDRDAGFAHMCDDRFGRRGRSPPRGRSIVENAVDDRAAHRRRIVDDIGNGRSRGIEEGPHRSGALRCTEKLLARRCQRRVCARIAHDACGPRCGRAGSQRRKCAMKSATAPTIQSVKRSPAAAEASVGSPAPTPRSEEHTAELQSIMRISYAVFCLKKKKINTTTIPQ